MDATDLQLIECLAANCRRPLREVADHLGISVAATHKRLLALEEGGVIRACLCYPHTDVFGAEVVVVYGMCESPLSVDASQELGQDDRVLQVTLASGNAIYMTLVLRSADGLDAALDAIQAKISLRVIEIGFARYNGPPCQEKELTDFDYAISQQMYRHARKPVSEMARALGTTAKTVRRRLDYLLAKNALIFTVWVDPMATNQHWAIFHIRISDPHRSDGIRTAILRDHKDNVSSVTSFRNLPNLLHLHSLSYAPKGIETLRRQLMALPGVESVMPSLYYSMEFFPVWIRTYIWERAALYHEARDTSGSGEESTAR